MNISEIVMALLFVTAFVVLPIALIQYGSRSKHGITSKLQECPKCGAQNHQTKEHCYCCGYSLIPAQSDATNAALIQRVKQADDNKMRRGLETQAAEGKPVEKTL